ncbi:HNH endonuclease signature motif containing protein [Parafrankia sp. FMc2]|uniref:HNH endonuclease signature motif containing protein n=1 Tax=Parafrankia sp. FMc2 TaxID=3233196 RepID=UPI0034D77DF3
MQEVDVSLATSSKLSAERQTTTLVRALLDAFVDLTDHTSASALSSFASTPIRGEGEERSQAPSRSAVQRFRDNIACYRAKAMLLAWTQAALIQDLANLAALTADDPALPRPGDPTLRPEDVAIEIGVSSATAARDMTFARATVDRLPRALSALREGKIDVQRLRSLENATRPLDDALASHVEHSALAGGPRSTRRAFTDACRQIVHTLDPEGAATRQVRRAERRVRVSAGEDGIGRLTTVMPVDEAEACFRRVDRIARGITARGVDSDERTIDQIRADVVVDLLTGRGEHAAPLACEIQVLVPVTALLGTTSTPGEIPGIGSIPAAVAREMANRPGSTWRRILTDPRGRLVEVADRRHPSPAQARHVRARDQTCRHPGCRRPAVSCDLDHTVPYAQGGPTRTCNLGPLCERHHGGRHRGGWKICQPRPGVFQWTTGLGHSVTVTETLYPGVVVEGRSG